MSNDGMELRNIDYHCKTCQPVRQQVCGISTDRFMETQTCRSIQGTTAPYVSTAHPFIQRLMARKKTSGQKLGDGHGWMI